MRRSIAWAFRKLLPGLLLVPAGAGSADAQRTLRTIGKDVANGVADILYVWSAPARAEGRDWAGAGLAAAVVLAAAAADRDVHRWIVDHPSSVVMDGIKPFREGRDVPLVHLGSSQRIQPLAGALYLVGFLADSRALRDAAMGCTAALQAQGIVHSLTLHVVQRERPLTSDGDPHDFAWGDGPWERHAFYGGHAANVMACVSYGNERFHMDAAEPVLYTLALGVALGRMADQRHWASDIAVGTLVGHAVGTTVGRRARKRAERVEREKGAPPGTGMLDRAYVTGGAGGVTIGWRTAF
jgi:membrane-associated phospholipid phosphatase